MITIVTLLEVPLRYGFPPFKRRLLHRCLRRIADSDGVRTHQPQPVEQHAQLIAAHRAVENVQFVDHHRTHADQV